MRRRFLLLPLALAIGGCGASAQRPASRAQTVPPSTTPAPAPTTTAKPSAPKPPPPAPKPKPKPKPSPKPQPDPGSLPQTHQLPSADSPAFQDEMKALWAGVQTNSLARARAAFFPPGAYVQLKAIGDAAGDYSGRLLGDYRLDLGAAHALLGPDPASARLIAVHVPQGYAHWVDPGVCYNRAGYYEVPNARVVYRQNGTVRSFGIASMISWRGVWYVIHLGAILRQTAGGVVDDPSPGSGQSAPSSTC